jgi:hypothetical protein
MSNEENDPATKSMPLGDIKTEPGADDLLESPAMQPYLDLAVAVMGGKDSAPAVAAIAALPLEERYVWRVASALKWAFADFDTVNVEADRQTLSGQDQQRLMKVLEHRPLQFCLFLSALVGEKQMELLMVSALRNARLIAAHSADPERP